MLALPKPTRLGGDDAAAHVVFKHIPQNHLEAAMPGTHYDLSMTSYGLLGLLVVGHEALGLRTTLVAGLTLLLLLLALSLLGAFVSHLRKKSRRSPSPSKWVGRHP
jgi:hypothetical protein